MEPTRRRRRPFYDTACLCLYLALPWISVLLIVIKLSKTRNDITIYTESECPPSPFSTHAHILPLSLPPSSQFPFQKGRLDVELTRRRDNKVCHVYNKFVGRLQITAQRSCRCRREECARKGCPCTERVKRLHKRVGHCANDGTGKNVSLAVLDWSKGEADRVRFADNSGNHLPHLLRAAGGAKKGHLAASRVGPTALIEGKTGKRKAVGVPVIQVVEVTVGDHVGITDRRRRGRRAGRGRRRAHRRHGGYGGRGGRAGRRSRR